MTVVASPRGCRTMAKENGGQPAFASAPPEGPSAEVRYAVSDARKASSADQMVAEADQSASDSDQVASDTDQTASDRDQSDADRDQEASDHDQEAADKDRAAHSRLSPDDEKAYRESKEIREGGSSDRLGNRLRRQATARDRDAAAAERDRVAEIRDEGGRGRDASAARLAMPASEREAQLMQELERLRAQAASDRVRAADDRSRAADDRSRAASDRVKAATDRTRLEAELHVAHLDELTGAYRREMGRLVLTHEIERAERSGGPFIVAFVDVDQLKDVNDHHGHAAGDSVLKSVVEEMRSRLRSFDPIIRQGGDEFVCGIGGTDLAEAERRFDLISDAIQEQAGVGISVEFAELESGDTADELTQRADEAMFEVKASHHSGS